MPKDIFNGALAVAEASRDKAAYTGFMGGIFEAEARWRVFADTTVPKINQAAEKIIGDFRAMLLRLDTEAVNREREIPAWVFEELKRLGIWGVKIPEIYGGIKLSQHEYQTIATLCGSVDASLTVLISAAQSIGVPEPLRIFGTEAQKQKYLPRLARGEISGFALTEPRVGCDISKIETYAVRIKKLGKIVGYRLTGQKFFITNSPKKDGEFLASMLVVIARIVDVPEEIYCSDAPKNYGAFIVETNSPGCSVERLHFGGVKAIYNGAPKFENVYVPAENLLQGENNGLHIALATLTVGRLTLPAACLGGLKQCLAAMRWWGKQRVQWGKSIGNHTLIGEMICRTAARVLALESIVIFCAAEADAGKDVRIESAAAKVLGSEWYLDAALDLVQMRGGRGFMETASQKKWDGIVVPAMQMLDDACINPIWEGTSQILRLWMMREMLANYLENQKLFSKGNISQKLQALGYFLRMGYRVFAPRFNKSLKKYSRKEAKKYHKFAADAAKNLTRTAITAMILRREKLLNEQLVLKKMADEAMNIFALSALAWRVSNSDNLQKPHIIEIADYLYYEIKHAFYPSFTRFGETTWLLAKNERTALLSQSLINGECLWLEDGIITFLEKQNQRPA